MDEARLYPAMTDLVAFLLAAGALLLAPGPTNTLLAASGAAAGFTRAAPLLAAEATGYAVAILGLAAGLGPMIAAAPGVEQALKAGAAAYLAYAAWRLWREGGRPTQAAAPAPFGRVLTTTLLNPKALLFALVVIPHWAEGRWREGAPYFAALMALIPVIGALWIALGAAARAQAKGFATPALAKRAGAVALGGFAAALAMAALPGV